MSDEIEKFFMDAVRAQALVHTGEHFCIEHAEFCKEREILCDDCPMVSPANRGGPHEIG